MVCIPQSAGYGIQKGTNMNLRVVVFQGEETYIKKFIDFPGQLYPKKERMQDRETETALLQGRHCLCKTAEVWGILVLNQEEKPVARCMASFYEGDDYGFFGFFECIENQDVCHRLIGTVGKLAGQRGRSRLIGPVDVSFWMNYRLKIDHFGNPHTAEPYNKEYYFRLLQAEGFSVMEDYVSDIYSTITVSDKYTERLEKQLAEGYELRSPARREYKSSLRDIYHLMTEISKDVPVYKDITEEQFFALFSDWKSILDFKLVKLVYRESRLVGFCAAIPNYGNLRNRARTLSERFRVMCARRKSREYILLYMGYDSKHSRVKFMLSTCIQKEMMERQGSLTGAVVPKNDGMESPFEGLPENTYRYVLLTAQL